MSLLQWNCRGYSSNYGDIITLLKDIKPMCVCLQETMLESRTPRPPQGYNIEFHSTSAVPTPGDGLCILIHSSRPYTHHPLNTNLQAMAIRVGLNKTYTICNIYITPNQNFTYAELDNIINQLPEPFIMMGDFNGKHTMWGNDIIDHHGRIIEHVFSNANIAILNTGSATHFHVQTGSTSAIDLSICSPALLQNLSWRVLNDLHGSDHFHI